MKKTRQIIETAFREYRPVLAYSGGGDSTVLLDIVCEMGYRPPLIYADSQMEYTSALPFVQDQADHYGLDLHVARAEITPQQCWQRYGFPMLGKMSARKWMQKHPAETWGFKIDVSTCCRKMKIAPGRKLCKRLGCNAMLTGQRGGQDDLLRGLRAHRDGAICELKQDLLTQVNPLTGWTDLMLRRYTEQHRLAVNPERARGAMTIGCMYCGGGAQFDNSGFRILRHTDPEAWRRMLKDYDFAPVILAIKYECHLDTARRVIERLGGLDSMMDTMPHVFDFLRTKPLKGYAR